MTTRREFLEFLGYSSVAVGGLSISNPVRAAVFPYKQNFTPLQKGLSADAFTVASGFDFSVLARWGDPITPSEKFGFNCDFIAFVPDEFTNPVSGTLWVNHEYVHPLFVSGFDKAKGKEKTEDQIIAEQEAVGGSAIRIQKNRAGIWEYVKNDARNFRLTGRTRIPLSSEILKASFAVGTFGNCGGGVTPWGTILTCEENFQDYYGDRKFAEKKIAYVDSGYGWHQKFDYPPEHYGWVVEIDLGKKTSKKLTSIGRFAHESATCILASDGRCVVYSGDDANNEFIYKFISDKPGSLENGTLYVANTERGVWIPLDLNKSPQLKTKFKDQTQVLIWAREAAKLLGATPQDRPEDIDINPNNGDVLVALTNNSTKNNYFGSILKIKEKNSDYLSLEFTASTFLTGGEDTGFACPDNMAFDLAGNLWFTSDISGSKMNKPPYATFGNNGLFVVPKSGKDSGKVLQVASAPMDAELTGPCFTPDGKTLFLSVQHPGEETKSLEAPTSHWPDGGSSIPKPSVVAITGPALSKLNT